MNNPHLICSDRNRPLGCSGKKMAKHLKIIIDYDGTLTAEEAQIVALSSSKGRA